MSPMKTTFLLLGPVALYLALLVVLLTSLRSLSFSYAAAMWIIAGVCATVAIVQGYTANHCYTSETCRNVLDFFACVTFWSAGIVVTYDIFVMWLNWRIVGWALVVVAVLIFLSSASDYFRNVYRNPFTELQRE